MQRTKLHRNESDRGDPKVPPPIDEAQLRLWQDAWDSRKQVSPLLNGCYTITSPSGEHRTLRIRTQSLDAKFRPGERIIGLLVGQDNETSFQQFGFVTDKGIRVWRRWSDRKGFHVRIATMLWEMVTRGKKSDFLRMGCELQFEGRCIRCNRLLTHPISVKTGIGPICAGRAG